MNCWLQAVRLDCWDAFKVAVAQVGSVLFDTAATLERVKRLCAEASSAGGRLVVFPEALLGGYPKGLDFGAVVGSRTDAGKAMFLRYFKGAVACPGVETEMLAEWTQRWKLHIVIGVIERDGGTLYCHEPVVYAGGGVGGEASEADADGDVERLIWGMGDGSTMQVVETEIGRIGMAICWGELHAVVPATSVWSRVLQLWCAPTVDVREMWRTSMRHIAYEGRCFVLSALARRLRRRTRPEDLG